MVTRFQTAMNGNQLLVIAESTCPDSVMVVPYVAMLAERANVSLRIAGRTLGLPILANNRSFDGRQATPTIVILRGDYPLGSWVERPVVLRHHYVGRDEMKAWYLRDAGRTVVRELVELAERGRRFIRAV
jgi:hypothetical protein